MGSLPAPQTQTIITATDAIKLEQRAVDDIHPLISDVMARHASDPLPPGGLLPHWTCMTVRCRSTALQVPFSSCFGIACLSICSINKVPDLPKEFAGLDKLRNW